MGERGAAAWPPGVGELGSRRGLTTLPPRPGLRPVSRSPVKWRRRPRLPVLARGLAFLSLPAWRVSGRRWRRGRGVGVRAGRGRSHCARRPLRGPGWAGRRAWAAGSWWFPLPPTADYESHKAARRALRVPQGRASRTTSPTRPRVPDYKPHKAARRARGTRSSTAATTCPEGPAPCVSPQTQSHKNPGKKSINIYLIQSF